MGAVLSPVVEREIRDSFRRQSFLRLIGATLAEVSAGRAVVALDVREDLLQQHGTLHAAAVTAIADVAAGYAGQSVLPAGSSVVSAEFKINFLRPAAGRRFRAVGEVVRAGRTLTVTQAVVEQVDGAKSVPCAVCLLYTSPSPRD